MQGHCTTWLRYRIAAFTAVKATAEEARMFIKEQHARLEPANATVISYTLLRHLGLMLDELSAQGLQVWQDERHKWRWAWAATEVRSERGYWALGEAIVDAVVTRYPTAFDGTAVVDVE
jgi:hypothetical protein